MKIKLAILLIIAMLLMAADVPMNNSSAGMAPQNSLANATAGAGDLPISAYGIQGSYGWGSYLRNLDSWNNTHLFRDQTFFAGDFQYGDNTRLYVLDYHWYELDVIDVSNLTLKLIGQSKPLLTEEWSGMTGAANGLMYASSTECGAQSTLYTIDLNTGKATRIGTIQNAPCVIDIVSLPNGDMYGIDIYYDTLIKINPENGLAQTVGPLGFNANYAQGMDYSVSDQTLYYLAWNQDTGGGELRTIDIATGYTTFIAPLSGGVQMEVIAFPNDQMRTYLPVLER
jgi:hypothetical protein